MNEVITTNKKIGYINLEVAFDIEVTSTYLADGNKSAFMYVWMIGFKNSDFVYFGRTWDEFVKFMDMLQVLWHELCKAFSYICSQFGL